MKFVSFPFPFVTSQRFITSCVKKKQFLIVTKSQFMYLSKK
ncbi:hypothetical protein FM107_09555 [Sphingobacterium sp. JB170]|nr:hypothetical protein FM107_09555 [Sphingobacterium sp. JB170]